MIEKLSIKNFKSIKDLAIDCRRVNLFIGEPNTGKSNILEALGLLSWCGYLNTDLREYVRIQGTQDLFYDGLLNQMVEVKIEKDTESLGAKVTEPLGVNIKFENDAFLVNSIFRKGKPSEAITFRLAYSADKPPEGHRSAELAFIKFYRFVQQEKFLDISPSFLMPPHGSNMFAVVMANEKLKKTMSRFFKDYGFQIVLKPQEKTFEVMKQMEDMPAIYPYILTSDTLKRIIFHVIAMESNSNSTLVFEEPESHAFPYHTKYLGEKIAFDEANQYFIATHNPYILLSILEKTQKDDVNVCITYFDFRNYQTKVKCLNDEEVSELMVYDPFANLDYFIDDEKDEEEEE